jgi:KaiC/GvpD/RAD55 family RecA-like ATPase
LSKRHPAVVVSGPPGSGKTHTIANVISAYLCRGMRVLVTSKNASALSVIRDRLPGTVHDLCVDVSASELTGMRQLQQTVERLANRISCANSDVETEKCQLLQVN